MNWNADALVLRCGHHMCWRNWNADVQDLRYEHCECRRNWNASVGVLRCRRSKFWRTLGVCGKMVVGEMTCGWIGSRKVLPWGVFWMVLGHDYSGAWRNFCVNMRVLECRHNLFWRTLRICRRMIVGGRAKVVHQRAPRKTAECSCHEGLVRM
jgi:hypothetical protein